MTEGAMWILILGASAGGVVAGWNAGRARASDAIWKAVADRTGGEIISPPAREAVIGECIDAVKALRPNLGAAQSMEDFHQTKWIRCGIDAALDALYGLNKRGAGHIAEARLRGALAAED